MSEAILDTARLIALREAAGLSQRSLARLLPISFSTVSTMERGTNHHALTLDLLRQLAAALRVEPAELLARPAREQQTIEGGTPQLDGMRKVTDAGAGENQPEAKSPPDDAVIEALLLHGGTALSRDVLARALNWTTGRTLAALHQLGARLDGTGIRLVQTQRYRWKLEAEDSILSTQQRAAVERAEQGKRGVTLGVARMLQRVQRADAPVHYGSLSNPDRVAFDWLRRLALITTNPEGQTVLADRAAFSLGLSDEPPGIKN